MKLNLKQYLFLFSLLCVGMHSNAQFSKATSKWKALLSNLYKFYQNLFQLYLKTLPK